MYISTSLNSSNRLLRTITSIQISQPAQERVSQETPDIKKLVSENFAGLVSKFNQCARQKKLNLSINVEYVKRYINVIQWRRLKRRNYLRWESPVTAFQYIIHALALDLDIGIWLASTRRHERHLMQRLLDYVLCHLSPECSNHSFSIPLEEFIQFLSHFFQFKTISPRLTHSESSHPDCKL